MLRNNFSKEKIKEIRKKVYKKEKIDKYFSERENTNKTKQEEREKKYYTKESKKVGEFLEKLKGEDLNRLEKHRYLDNDDLDYKGIKQIENLLNKIDEDYYKPIKIKSAFNNKYIEYESKGDKDKILSVKEYLFMIRPYLSDMINSHKAPIRDSNDITIEDDLSGEWKIQLTMQVSFISSLDPGEI